MSVAFCKIYNLITLILYCFYIFHCELIVDAILNTSYVATLLLIIDIIKLLLPSRVYFLDYIRYKAASFSSKTCSFYKKSFCFVNFVICYLTTIIYIS